MTSGTWGTSWATRSAAAFMALVATTGCAADTTGAPRAGGGRTSSPSASASPAPPPGPPGALPRPGEVGRIPRSADGLPPVISSVPTRRKVVFLTIDDGWEQDPGFLAQVRDRRIPIAAFLTRDAVEARGTTDPTAQGGRFIGAGKWDYMRDLRDAGATIENHTLTHPNLVTLGYDGQKAEICGTSTLIRKHLGERPALFRPPFGNHNTLTRRAAKACGIDALLLWTATVQPGGKIAYQVPDKKLRPGDVLLLHFRPNLSRDFRILVNKIKRRGFELGNLDTYLKAALR
ncbi:polysaccharide deacetylase family protein [Streptosporangium sp. NBC_01639]|uniref:polysaccharide deacetylase family protein n=1 Tax=Streptosporangium sp. NBC_01639 TaxID=2975948 RepID=UPI00386C73B1|nr:polysaccharide deacetylase family protein [Streptosporangium sp. NBC_01639]